MSSVVYSLVHVVTCGCKETLKDIIEMLPRKLTLVNVVAICGGVRCWLLIDA